LLAVPARLVVATGRRGLAERGGRLAVTGLAVAGLAISGLARGRLAGGLLAVAVLAAAPLAVAGLAEGGGRLALSGLPVGRLARTRLSWTRLARTRLSWTRLARTRLSWTRLARTRLSRLPGLAWWRVSGLAVAALAGSRGRLVCSRDRAARRGRAGAAEAQACQAVLSLVRPRRGLLVDSISREFRPGPVLAGQVLAGRVLPGGVLGLGAGPLISRVRDYPGALRRSGVILFSQVARSGRLLTGGPVRLVPGRDG
jgi:hypothetical protein